MHTTSYEAARGLLAYFPAGRLGQLGLLPGGRGTGGAR